MTSTRALGVALVVLAVVIVAQAAAGFAQHLAWGPPLALATLAIAGASWFGRRRRRRGGPLGTPATATTTTIDRADADERAADRDARAPTPGAHALAVGAGAAIVLALGERFRAALWPTSFLYDVLSYHLHLPAAWRAAGALQVVPTPFGDQAPAYAPANAELVFHLAMWLTGDATLALGGQLPFAALACLALYATSRELGAARASAALVALAFLMIPEVWQQSATAMADLAMAALFFAALPSLLRLGRLTRETEHAWSRGLVLAGVALGLLIGTKYVGLLLALPLGVWAAWSVARGAAGVHAVVARFAVLAGLMLACGGFWYVRTALVTGNPLYPVRVALGPLALGPGLFDRAAMRRWDYHVPVGELGALGELLREPGWAALSAMMGGVALAARARQWRLLAIALATLAIAWLVIPYQHSRFLFATWGVSLVLLASVSRTFPRLATAALLLATVGGALEFPTPGRLVAVLGGAAVGLGIRLWSNRRRPAREVAAIIAGSVDGDLADDHPVRLASDVGRGAWVSPRLAAGVVVVGLAVIAAVTVYRRGQPPPEYAVGDDHDAAWAWLRTAGGGHRIAYAGTNLPFPFRGPRFQNQVRYVGVAGPLGAGVHELGRGPFASAEPAPERASPVLADWLANLRQAGTDLLVVSAAYPIVRRAMATDADGFPIERAWADADPARFQLRFVSEGVRVYKVVQVVRNAEVARAGR